MNTVISIHSGAWIASAISLLMDSLKCFALVLFWMLAHEAAASETQPAEAEYALQLHARDGDEHWPAPVLSTQVDMQVTGPILRATVTQRFANPAQVWVEARYAYPLPDTAAVDAFTMRVGERVIEGQIQEKAKARARYQQAKQSGQRASLLQQHQGNRFSTSVANIPPGEEIEVQFEFQQVLDFEDHGYQLRFPMVATPPYTSSRISDSDVEGMATQPGFERYQHPASPNRNPVGIRLELDAGFPLSQVLSRSHPIQLNRVDASRYQVSLDPDARLSDRDFTLEWHFAAHHKPQVNVFHETNEQGEFGMVMVLPPSHDTGAEQAGPRELVLVMDVSGSMQGESIRQARAAALDALDGLDADDYFNLVHFSHQAYRLFSRSEPATATNLRLARQTIQGIEAGGGTEMHPALELALMSDGEEARLRQVVFITDGAVTHEDHLFALIEKRLGSSRLFTVGIGSAPNHYFMRRAAESGRGVFTYISRPQDVNTKMRALLRRLQSPALTGLSVNWEGDVSDSFPAQLPDLYLGQALVMVFRTASFPAAMTLGGERLERDESTRLLLDEASNGKGIGMEWARRQLAELQARHARAGSHDKAMLREDIVSLALEHHLVTPFTSFVAVDATPVRAGGELKSSTIPSNLPKGSANKLQPNSQPRIQHKAQSIMLAQTASGLPTHVMWGVMALLLAMGCWRYGLGLSGLPALIKPVIPHNTSARE